METLRAPFCRSLKCSRPLSNSVPQAHSSKSARARASSWFGSLAYDSPFKSKPQARTTSGRALEIRMLVTQLLRSSATVNGATKRHDSYFRVLKDIDCLTLT
eukprot:2255281-Amphidinium_carterae.2